MEPLHERTYNPLLQLALLLQFESQEYVVGYGLRRNILLKLPMPVETSVIKYSFMDAKYCNRSKISSYQASLEYRLTNFCIKPTQKKLGASNISNSRHFLKAPRVFDGHF